MVYHFKFKQNVCWFFCLVFFATIAIAQNPGETWDKFVRPEQAGWSSEKLKGLYDNSDASALLIVYNGKIVATFGNIQRRYKCHSVRKSFLSALYGIYEAEGVIDLNKTLKELNIDDITPLTESEKEAQIIDLLKARSGVYIPAGAESLDMKESRPERDSHPHDTFWYYNNWDFNVLGTIFEKETQQDIFEAFYHQIAEPLQMEDFRLMDGTHDYYERRVSIHPSYPFKVSARDMARFGQLYLQKGKWNEKQIIPEKWIEDSITSHSYHADNGKGYGYLWWTDENFNGSKMYHASGYGGHYIGVFPAEQVVIVLRADTYTFKSIQNRQNLIQKIFSARDCMPEKNPKFIPFTSAAKMATIPLSEDDKNKYVGAYKGIYLDTYGLRDEAGPEHRFFILMRDGDLILERYDYFYHFSLLPLSKERFFVEDLELFLTFEFDDNGNPIKPVFHKTEVTEKLYDTIRGQGIAASIKQFEELKDGIKDEFDLKFLAYNLSLIGKHDEALEVLRLNVARFNQSLNCHRYFVKKYLELKDIQSLSRAYEQILHQLKKEQKDYTIVQWYDEWLRARAYPIPLSDEEKERYVGNYGPRHVIVKNGELYYYRDNPIIREYRMVKLSENVFVLDDNFTDEFRIKFVLGKDNKASKLIGFYINGYQDESVRSNNRAKE
jgi:CubicO group peptidase (beta-lactamase class C family)